MYRVLFSRRARKSFRRFQKPDAQRIRAALDRLAQDPRMPGTIRLVNAPVADYRYRVGNFRILFEIDDEPQQILIYDVRRRDERTYRRR